MLYKFLYRFPNLQLVRVRYTTHNVVVQLYKLPCRFKSEHSGLHERIFTLTNFTTTLYKNLFGAS
jgi:hypothetical protein